MCRGISKIYLCTEEGIWLKVMLFEILLQMVASLLWLEL
jgi:hypothetical protein